MRHDDKIIVFTADAGVMALYKALAAYPILKDCEFMQIPHHGSWHNVSPG